MSCAAAARQDRPARARPAGPPLPRHAHAFREHLLGLHRGAEAGAVRLRAEPVSVDERRTGRRRSMSSATARGGGARLAQPDDVRRHAAVAARRPAARGRQDVDGRVGRDARALPRPRRWSSSRSRCRRATSCGAAPQAGREGGARAACCRADRPSQGARLHHADRGWLREGMYAPARELLLDPRRHMRAAA